VEMVLDDEIRMRDDGIEEGLYEQKRRSKSASVKFALTSVHHDDDLFQFNY
jgi:hypothetical protein